MCGRIAGHKIDCRAKLLDSAVQVPRLEQPVSGVSIERGPLKVIGLFEQFLGALALLSGTGGIAYLTEYCSQGWVGSHQTRINRNPLGQGSRGVLGLPILPQDRSQRVEGFSVIRFRFRRGPQFLLGFGEIAPLPERDPERVMDIKLAPVRV